MTPLHAACLAGNVKAVDLLLDQPNVDFMKKDKVLKLNLIILEKLHSTPLCSCERSSSSHQASPDFSPIFHFTKKVSIFAGSKPILNTHGFGSLKWKLQNPQTSSRRLGREHRS